MASAKNQPKKPHIREQMKAYAVGKVGKPRGERGNYNLGQAMELHLASMDFVADQIEVIDTMLREFSDRLDRMGHNRSDHGRVL